MNSNSTAFAILAAVFFAGVAGTLGVLRIVEHRPFSDPPARERMQRDGPFRGGGPSDPGEFMGLARLEFSDRLAERLDLTPEQREQLQEIMDRRSAFAKAEMERIRPILRQQIDSLNLEIESVLNEGQRAEFREFVERDRNDRRRRGRRGSRAPTAR